MPIASVNGLSTQQVEAILLHELAHIRRNDYLVNLMVTSIEIILFFNPFSRLFIRNIKRERENSCDDLVLQFQYNAHAYASALLVIEKKRVMKVALGMAATGKNNRMLLDRVKRILNQPVTTSYNNRMVAHLFAGLLLAFIAWSNPGNVIVKNILQDEATLIIPPRENQQPIFASQPLAASFKETRKPAKKKPLKPAIDITISSEDIDETPELISQVAYQSIQYVPQIIQASSEKLRDFSITEQLTVDKPAEIITLAPTPTPFVPGSSFSYFSQDSTKPGLVVVSPQEKAATESLRKALKALEEINWEKLGKELKESGDKIDVAKLQEEIKKSLKQIDWEKINAETKLEMLQLDAKVRQDNYLRELTKVKQSQQMQEHFQNLQKKILEDQIKCQQEQQKREQELREHLQKKNNNNKNTTKPAKKVVYI
jgi:hypothetical protein